MAKKFKKPVPKPDSFQFTLWKENRLDQEYKMTLGEFKPKFFEFIKEHPRSWLEYYGVQGSLQKFVGNKEYLNSVIEPDMYSILFDETHEEAWEIIKGLPEDKK